MSDETLDYTIYNRPDDVPLDNNLSHQEKVDILKKWTEDQNALIRASAEGLQGGEQNHLREAEMALEKLQKNEKA